MEQQSKYGPEKLYPCKTAPLSLTRAQRDWLKRQPEGQAAAMRKLIDEAIRLEEVWGEPEVENV
jgi:hypothetical protein